MIKALFGTFMILLGIAVAGLAAVVESDDGGWTSRCTTSTTSGVQTENCYYDGRVIDDTDISRLAAAGIGVGLLVGGSAIVAGARGRDRRTAAPQAWVGAPPAPPHA